MPLIECLAENDSHELILIESELTVAKAMNSVNLKKLDKIIGKKNILKSIVYLIMRLSDNFNMKGKFNSSQSAVLALDLFEVFGYESLEDVMLMFKYARQGKIGDGNDFKLDSQTVFHKWVPAYLELKAVEREKKVQKEKDNLKKLKPENIDKSISEKLFKDVGEIKVNHKRKGSGLGSRLKGQVLNEREYYLDHCKQRIKKISTDKLKKYIENPKDQGLLKLVEKEIENRKSKINQQ